MGSSWSSGVGAKPGAATGGTASQVPPLSAEPPLQIDDIRAETAAWDQVGICRSVQRFLGLLPDSPTEILKQQQRFPVFVRRSSTSVFVLDSGDSRRSAAIVAVQCFYRRYRLLRMWREAALPLLKVARERLESQREADKAELTVARFRQMLIEGFAANKVTILGELKTIQLRLVANAEKEEFYLTWTPSRKRSPRIYLHDVEEVVPVMKEGNRYAPKLSGKVSHRRGLVILCKSHHRGRVILEVGSKQERKLLLRGFARLLEEMQREEPIIDDTGVLRRRMPRRKSVADFFDGSAAAVTQTPTSAMKAADPSWPTATSRLFHQARTADRVGDESPRLLPGRTADASLKRRLSIEELYRTRFDPPSPTSEPDMNGGDVSKTPLRSPTARRSSAVIGVRGAS